MINDAYERGVQDALARFKTADIAKLVRALKTPIPGTPKLLMGLRSKAVLDAEEHALRNTLRDGINGNIYKGLKKLKVDRAYQKLEPFIGSATAPAAERATYGDRQIHEMAHRPFHFLLGNAPIPYAATAHNALSVAHQKLLNVPPPRAYGTAPNASAPAPEVSAGPPRQFPRAERQLEPPDVQRQFPRAERQLEPPDVQRQFPRAGRQLEPGAEGTR